MTSETDPQPFEIVHFGHAKGYEHALQNISGNPKLRDILLVQLEAFIEEQEDENQKKPDKHKLRQAHFLHTYLTEHTTDTLPNARTLGRALTLLNRIIVQNTESTAQHLHVLEQQIETTRHTIDELEHHLEETNTHEDITRLTNERNRLVHELASLIYRRNSITPGLDNLRYASREISSDRRIKRSENTTNTEKIQIAREITQKLLSTPERIRKSLTEARNESPAATTQPLPAMNPEIWQNINRVGETVEFTDENAHQSERYKLLKGRIYQAINAIDSLHAPPYVRLFVIMTLVYDTVTSDPNFKGNANFIDAAVTYYAKNIGLKVEHIQRNYTNPYTNSSIHHSYLAWNIDPHTKVYIAPHEFRPPDEKPPVGEQELAQWYSTQWNEYAKSHNNFPITHPSTFDNPLRLQAESMMLHIPLLNTIMRAEYMINQREDLYTDLPHPARLALELWRTKHPINSNPSTSEKSAPERNVDTILASIQKQALENFHRGYPPLTPNTRLTYFLESPQLLASIEQGLQRIIASEPKKKLSLGEKLMNMVEGVSTFAGEKPTEWILRISLSLAGIRLPKSPEYGQTPITQPNGVSEKETIEVS